MQGRFFLILVVGPFNAKLEVIDENPDDLGDVKMLVTTSPQTIRDDLFMLSSWSMDTVNN
jgi:hypothetical protein